VEVIHCPAPRQCAAVELALPEGATVAEAVAASGLVSGAKPGDAEPSFGVWGRACEADRRVEEGDRVEVYRPLVVSPLDARRLRHEAQAAAGPIRRGTRSR
jgi:putative ubiquitin-RnfH superfamily antitoxin RatB of RatAB toxin-antitoxin module